MSARGTTQSAQLGSAIGRSEPLPSVDCWISASQHLRPAHPTWLPWDFPVWRPCIPSWVAVRLASVSTRPSLPALPIGSGGALRQQGRGCLSREPVVDRLPQERVHRAALAAACGNHRPDPFAPAATCCAACPLGDVP